MTPAQWNEYERQAQVIERHQKWKEQQKQLITEIMEEDAKDGLYEISDEEIEKAAKKCRFEDLDISVGSFELGAKWYREQLKKESVTNCNQLTTK
jgi:hypothetical protein